MVIIIKITNCKRCIDLADVNLLKQIGERIYKKRRSLKMTQAQLAELVDVTTQYIGNLECGKAYPSIQMFLSLCYALYIDPNELLVDSLPEDGLACMRPYKLRSGESIYSNSLTGYLEIWWARSGIADLEAFARLPINELPLSCFMDLKDDVSPFLSL